MPGTVGSGKRFAVVAIIGLIVVIVATSMLRGRAGPDAVEDQAADAAAASASDRVGVAPADSPDGSISNLQVEAEPAPGVAADAASAGDAGGAIPGVSGARIPLPPEFADLVERDEGFAEFHERLEQEAEDPFWAFRIEEFLKNHFDASLAVNGFRIDSIECRSSACEVLAVGYGDDAFRQWMTSVSGLVNSFDSDEEFEAFFGGPGTMGCGGSDVSPGVIALNCTFQRTDPALVEDQPAETFSLETPYADGLSVERVPVDETVASAIETSREMYELHRRLERETRDYAWANYIEPLVAEYMGGLDPEQGIEFVDVVCRATLCEVQMVARDDDAFIEWLPSMFEFNREGWHDLTTAGLDGSEVVEGEANGLVWFLERQSGD